MTSVTPAELRICCLAMLHYLLWHGTKTSYKNIRISGLIVYIINGSVTRNKLDDISHRGYFMGYIYTIGAILYCNPDQTFIIHRSHHVWFDVYNSRLSIEDKHTPGSILLHQYT